MAPNHGKLHWGLFLWKTRSRAWLDNFLWYHWECPAVWLSRSSDGRCFLWDICEFMIYFFFLIWATVLLPSSSLGYQPAVNSRKQRWQGRDPDFVCDVFWRKSRDPVGFFLLWADSWWLEQHCVVETDWREIMEMYALGWRGENIGFTALRGLAANSAALLHYIDVRWKRPTG